FSSVLETLVFCYLADLAGPAAVSHMRFGAWVAPAGRAAVAGRASPASRTLGRACLATPA
ncbi:MAG: hypothetical protein ACRDNS_04160, partial [Trebonia sp.]